jgi:hypothetical protein
MCDVVADPRAGRSTLARALNAEWTTLCASAESARAVERWRTDPALRDCRDLPAVLAATGADRGVDVAEADHALAAVTVHAIQGDRVASRLVLQRVLPGLVTVAGRRAFAHRLGRQAVFDDLAAAAWEIIVNYPIGRRPRKIAANIVRDVEYRCFGYPARRHARREVLYGTAPATPTLFPVADLHGRPIGAPRHRDDEFAQLLEDAVDAGFSREDAGLLRELVLEGRSIQELAARAGVSDRAMRARRASATTRLAEVAA